MVWVTGLRCEVKRASAAHIDHACICPFLKQRIQARLARFRTLRRVHQGSLPVSGSPICLRAAIKQRLQDFGLACHGGEHERRRSKVIV